MNEKRPPKRGEDGRDRFHPATAVSYHPLNDYIESLGLRSKRRAQLLSLRVLRDLLV